MITAILGILDALYHAVDKFLLRVVLTGLTLQTKDVILLTLK